MSSIAYVTDRQMIEYHRLNANREINFWKPSLKKITNFKYGDFLFFLAKGTEKGIKKEKGILGYGKLKVTHILSFDQMWLRYGTKNGYATKEALEEAILKITKNHKLPTSLSCFELQEVTFFQAPVYLSEIGVEISNKIESYFYLDKDDMMNTSKILNVANKIGMDIWSNILYENDETFIDDAKFNFIMNINEKLKLDISKYEDIKVFKYCQHFITSANQKMVGRNAWIDYKDEKLSVFLPCLISINDSISKLQRYIGHYVLFNSYIQMSEYANSIDLILVFQQKLNQEMKKLLDHSGVQYKEKLVNDD